MAKPKIKKPVKKPVAAPAPVAAAPAAEPKRMGRPPKPIDWDEFDKLCALQCTLNEIASWFRVSIDTIENRCKKEHGKTFSECWAEKAASGRISLRRAQFQAAIEDRNPAMLIFLGKNQLGQRDRAELTGAEGGPLRHQVEDLRGVSLDEAEKRVRAAAEALACVREDQEAEAAAKAAAATQIIPPTTAAPPARAN